MRLAVGPVDGRLARTWLANSRAIVDAVRLHPHQLSVLVEEPLLDLIDAALVVWLDAAQGPTFEWESEVDAEHVVVLAEQWRTLASLTDDDLAVLGCHWAPPETLPVFDALVAAFADALRELPSTAPLGDALEERPPGR